MNEGRNHFPATPGRNGGRYECATSALAVDLPDPGAAVVAISLLVGDPLPAVQPDRAAPMVVGALGPRIPVHGFRSVHNGSRGDLAPATGSRHLGRGGPCVVQSFAPDHHKCDGGHLFCGVVRPEPGACDPEDQAAPGLQSHDCGCPVRSRSQACAVEPGGHVGHPERREPLHLHPGGGDWKKWPSQAPLDRTRLGVSGPR